MAALLRVYAGPGDALYVSVGECAGACRVCVRAPYGVCVCVCRAGPGGRAPSAQWRARN